MTNFRRGDVVFAHDNIAYSLRLTIGALARIDARLGASGPMELAEILRSPDCAHHAQALLACLLLRPPCAQHDTQAAVAQIAPEIYMPAIARVFELTFENQNDENQTDEN